MKSLAPVAASEQIAVEVHDWIAPTAGSRLVSNFARAHILMSLFDGEPEKWLEFVQRDGTPEERANDVPFINEVRRRAAADATYLTRLRDAMRAVTALL